MSNVRFSRGVVALILVLALAPAGAAATIDREDNQKLEGEAESAVPASGSLILDGEFIPPPYSIAVVGGQVAINGREIEKPAAASPAPVVSPSALARHQALDTLYGAFRSWRAHDSQEVAIQKAADLMKAQSVVERVVIGSTSSLRVKFRDERNEHTIELRPPDPGAVSAETMRERLLADRARTIDYALSRGSVVILGTGVMMITPRAESRALLTKLREIAESAGDVESRAAAIRAVVPDDTLARAIAERYVPAADSEGGRP